MKFYHLALFLLSSTLYSQRTTSQWYGMTEGLPQSSITDIAKDKYGFIWLATNGGIVRYDGVNFLVNNHFKLSNLNFSDFLSYGNNEITCLNNREIDGLVISNRTLKVLPKEKITRTNSFIKNIHFKRFYKNSFSSNYFPDIDYYYIDTGLGKYFFDNHKIEYEKAGSLQKTVLKQKFRFSNLKNIFEHNGIIYIADPQKRRTMILRNGTIQYDNQASLYNDPQSKIYWHQFTKQVFVINKGNIYISKAIKGKPTFKYLMHFQGIENELLLCMFYDEEVKKLYLGTAFKGLSIVNLSNFYVPTRNIPFSGEVCYEALAYTKNSLITKQGIEYFKNRASKIFSADIIYDKRYLIYDDDKNMLYIDSKLYRRYKNSNYQKKDSLTFAANSVEGLFKSRKYYMLTMSDHRYSSLNIFPDDQFKRSQNIFKFKEDINFVKEYNEDLLYVGTSKGIYIVSISANKIIKHIVEDLNVKEIINTGDGNFWITTYNEGFYYLKNNVATKIPFDKKGYVASAHTILEDKKGFFWISSNNGLFKISKKMLLEYCRNSKSKIMFYRYAKENGLPSNEFNGSANPSGNILPNGEFVFPSMGGFVFFKPEDIKSYYPKKDQIFVERAQVGKEIVFFKDTLRLKSDDKDVSVFLDIPYYYDIDNIYLEANLGDLKHDDWKAIGTDKKYPLDNIEPGNYTLTIRFLVDENGRFAYKKIFIEVVPYFYETALFKIIMVLLFTSAILIIIEMRTNFQKLKNKTLKNNLHHSNQELREASHNLEITKNLLKNESEYQQRIMESISHDIMTPVKFISYLSQKLVTTDDAETQKKYYDGIYKSSEQLFKFTLSLKEYNELYKEDITLDVEEHSIYNIIEDKKLLFKEIALDKNSVIINLSDPLLKIRVNKNIVATIIHNLIDNAVKHTVAGEIIIKTFIKELVVEIEISDTGTGMSKSQIQYYSEIFKSMDKENFVFKRYGLGLHMVIQLSKKIGAGISFHENMPTGTMVKVFLTKK